MALRRAARGLRQWVEPWYFAYALLGMTFGGITAILVPLGAGEIGGPSTAGVVMGALGLGQLSATGWGGLADRFRLHRVLFAGGILFVALAFLGLSIVHNAAAWIMLALLLGVGAAATNTVASLFIVEVHPQAEWAERIGWMQTIYSAGLVGGLLLAGAVSHLPIDVGLLLAMIAAGIGCVLGWIVTRGPARHVTVPSAAAPSATPGTHPALHAARRSRAPELLHALAHRQPAPWGLSHVHHPRLPSRHQLGLVLRSPFAVFLLVSMLTNLGPSAIFALYPLLMNQVFDIVPALSSLVLAVSAGAGLTLYTPSGRLSTKFGAVRILRASIGMRMVGMILLAVLAAATFGGRAWLALVAIWLMDLAWPSISVSSTTLAPHYSPLGEGEGMGVYNAANAAAGLLGAAVGGWLANLAGYEATIVLAAVSGAAALVLAVLLPAPSGETPTPSPAATPAAGSN